MIFGLLGWLLLYLLLWIIWWILIPIGKFLILCSKYDLNVDGMDYHKPLAFKLHYQKREIDICTTYVGELDCRKLKSRYIFYDLCDFIEFSIKKTIKKLKIKPDLEVNYIAYEEFKYKENKV